MSFEDEHGLNAKKGRKKLKKMANKCKPEYKSGWQQHKAEQKEGKKIEREEGGK